ncbi:MAG: DUF1799 domain-containing protein [Magnetospiraceae bacterium]
MPVFRFFLLLAHQWHDAADGWPRGLDFGAATDLLKTLGYRRRNRKRIVLWLRAMETVVLEVYAAKRRERDRDRLQSQSPPHG